METLKEKVERHFTLPEFLDALDVDFEDLYELTLEEFIDENSERIETLLSDYGD